MLKALMLRKKIDTKRSALEALIAKDADFAKRGEELESMINEVTNDEEATAVNEQIDKYDEEKTAHEDAKKALETEIDELQNELNEVEAKDPVNAEPTDRAGYKGAIERKGEKTMNLQIRTAPKNVKALDMVPLDVRSQWFERDDVKKFCNAIRVSAKEKRDISGGELNIPVYFLDLISENLYRYSKLLNRVRVRTVTGEARQTIAGTVPEAVWTEMCGAINELTLSFTQVTLDGYKVAGFIPVCNSLLEDSDVDLSNYIIEALSEAIGYAIDKAILYGKGSNSKMPLGIVTRLAETSQPSGYPSKAPAWVDLHTTHIISIDASLTNVEFFAKLTEAVAVTSSRYARGELFWAMNSKTYAKLKAKAISFTATGQIVTGVSDALPIVTGDVVVLEFIPDNDIIGGYGDLYLSIDRGDLEVDYDRSVQFIQDNTVFRAKARKDGMPIIPACFVAINIAGGDVTTVMDFTADTANDADLIELTLGSETLSPTFDADTTSYAVTATGTSAVISATTAQANAKVAISYNGKNVKNGGTVTFESGTLPLAVTVKNGNATKVYTITVTKA